MYQNKAMATSLDALEALLQFREGVAPMKSHSPTKSCSIQHAMHVPNPLDPKQPHIIEGDTPTSIAVSRPLAFGSGSKSAFTPKSQAMDVLVVSSVPNPLATPVVEKMAFQHNAQARISAFKPLPTLSSTQGKVVTHGFSVTSPAVAPVLTGSDARPASHALMAEVRTDKIVEALKSKPQRGKKRQNLNDFERQELTRTRNREHAKSTRLKKKQRLEELVEMEKKYLLLKEKESLDTRRREHIVQFVEAVGNGTDHKAKESPHSSKIIEIASQVILKPQFCVTDSVALTAANSGMVKVSAYGTDVESGKPKTLSAVICADFVPKSADISGVSIYWSSSKNTSSSVSIFPSVSVLSFES